MTLEQHITQNQAKNARRWTNIAARLWKESAYGIWYGEIKPSQMRNWRMVKDALGCIYLHTRKPETKAEARKLLAILETR